MAIRPFKLELVKTLQGGTSEKVSFGPRSFGDVGRDIMIVKRALGQLVSYQELVEGADVQPPGLEDPNGWFDCVTAEKVTDRQAATFDAGMQRYLMKYQLDNQFYILCYNFTKFNIAQNLESREDFNEREVNDSWWSAGYNNLKNGSISFKTGPVDNISDPDEKFFITLQMNIMLEMFEKELGELGEATLAVMHGWRPRSSVGNTSYYHPQEVFGRWDEAGTYAADLVLLGLFDAVVNNDLEQKFVSLDREGTDWGWLREPTINDIGNLRDYRENGPKAQEILELYEQQVAAQEEIPIKDPDYLFKSQHFGALKYSLVPIDAESVLYGAFKTAHELDPRDPAVPTQGTEDYASTIRRAFEPDPLTDPDPFYIDTMSIGFFDTTNYTLSNIPPASDSDEYRSIVSDLEDAALTKVLEFYAKPHVWFHDAEDPVFQGYYGVNRNPRMLPRHDETHTDLSKYCITTRVNAQRFSQDITEYARTSDGLLSPNLAHHTLGAFEHYENIDYDSYEDNIIYNSSEEPLIQFVEFRTPSLRPGDFYRAKFLINRRKLELISDGVYYSPAEEEQEEAAVEAAPIEAEQLSLTCDDSPPSLEQQQRRYEEYKALAAKRKGEIVRALRESALDNYKNEALAGSARVDLGVFGNANLNFGNWKTDSPEFRNMLVRNMGSLLGLDGHSSEGVTPPTFGGKNGAPLVLSITYQDLKELTKKAGENLKKAYQNCLKDGVTFKGITNYNGALEAAKLLEVPDDIKKAITADPGARNFDYGETDAGMTASGFIGGGTTRDRRGNTREFNTNSVIKIEFSQAPTGAKIKKITAGSAVVRLDKMPTKGTSLARPRTVGYLAQLYEVSGVKLAGNNRYEKIKSLLLSDNDGSCSDLGVGQKGLAFLIKHTIGLSGNSKEFNPLNQWNQWKEENFITPAKAWANRNGKNLENIFSYDEKYGTDALLKSFGDNCKSIGLFFRELFDKVSILQIICDYLKCLKLPAVNLTIPDFRIPDIPKLPIFGWWTWLIGFMKEKFEELLIRFLCSYARFILDILRFPICKQQLTDELFGTASMGTPGVKAALAEGLLQIDIRIEEKEKADQLIDEMGIFLTGDELCRILQGGELDPASMNMILKLADRLEIESLSDEEALRNFFETISLFIPEAFCEGLQQATAATPGRSTCAETADYTNQVRRRMLANEATEEEIQRAVDMANANLMDEVAALAALGEGGISALVPPAYDFGNPEAIMSDIPGSLKDSSNRTGKQIFEPVRTSYLTSLTTYKNSFYINADEMPKPDQEKYNERAALIVETILENLKLFKNYSEQSPGLSERKLHVQLYLLHQVYEIEKYHKPFIGPNELDERRLVTKSYKRPNNVRTKTPQISVSNFTPVPYDERGDYPISTIAESFFLNPVGYKLDGYYFANSSGKPITREDYLESLDLEDDELLPPDLVPLSISNLGSSGNFLNSNTSPLNNHPGIGLYKLLKRAILQLDDNDEDEQAQEEIGQQEAIKYLQQLVNERLRIIQQDLVRELEYLATPETSEKFLMVFKDIFDAAIENRNEEAIEVAAGGQEAVNAVQGEDLDAVFFNANFGSASPHVILREFPSTGRSETNIFDPYTVVVNGRGSIPGIGVSSLINGPTTFSYCDKLPGPGQDPSNDTLSEEERSIYVDAISDIPAGLYTRRELMSRMFWGRVKASTDAVFDNIWEQQEEGVPQEREVLNSYKEEDNILRLNFYDKQFLDFKEGIFEQILFALRRSRLFNEEYFDSFIRRVMGRTTVEKREDGTECYRNAYNISSFGLLSFEKVVTDEFEKQLQSEMARPENKPENLDFDDLGPFEKAIQNVAILGFIRLCITEFILKGALPFSVWDLQGVADEQVIKDYLHHFVAQELRHYQGTGQNWKKVVSRISGIANAHQALKSLVESQFLNFIGTSSTLFENNHSADYYNWFIKYGIPQTEVSRRYVLRRPNRTQRIRTDGNFRVLELELEEGDDGQEVANIEQRDIGQIEEFFGDDVIRGEGLQADLILRPNEFYWSHPLEDAETNWIAADHEFSDLLPQNAESVRNATLNGNNNFFHIEHCIELRGPLARLESIVLPVRKIVEDITNLDVEEALADDDPENDNYITVVDSARRSPERLNVINARARFANSVIPVDIRNYRIRQRPLLPAEAAGSTLETAGQNVLGDYNYDHEIMHIEDFIAGIRNALNAEDLEKYFYHLQMRLHYSEDLDSASGPRELNTDVREAEGYHEIIRRTPTRLITRKRRYIKFSRDYLLNDIDEYFHNTISVVDYKNEMYNGNTQSLILEGNNEVSQAYYNNFSQFSELEKMDEDRYYIVTANGETLLKMRALLESDPTSVDVNGFGSAVNTDLYAYLEDQTGLNMSGLNSSVRRHILTENGFRRIESGDDTFQHGLRLVEQDGPRLLGNFKTENYLNPGFFYEDVPFAAQVREESKITKDTSHIENLDQPGVGLENVLYHLRQPAGEWPEMVFENHYGDFGENKAAFDTAKDMISEEGDDLFTEEVYLETVFSFTDFGSLICGLKGSYNIAETHDEAAHDFQASAQTKARFENSLKKTLQELGYKYDQDADSHFEVKDLRDTKLTQYGRTFYKLKSDGGAIRLGRPMGIDPHTNVALTTKVLCRTPYSEAYQSELMTRPDDRGLTQRFRMDIIDEQGNLQEIVPNDPAPLYGRSDFAVGDWAIPNSNQNYDIDNLGLDRLRTIKAIRNTPIREDYSEVSKHIFSRPTLNHGGDNFSLQYQPGSILAPNLYRVPIRIVITQVYKNNAASPQEVYCKIVPPRYFGHSITIGQNTYPKGNLDENLDADQFRYEDLNAAIQKIVNEYVEFVKDASDTLVREVDDLEPEADHDLLSVEKIREKIEDFPDFTTDFGNDSHALGNSFRSTDFKKRINSSDPKKWNHSHLDLDSFRQYCSIERIYSEAFHHETNLRGFNSRDEIDRILSKDRGSLLKNTGRINTRVLDSSQPFSEKKSYLMSKTLFYQQARWDLEQDVEGGIESTALGFHQTNFSLINIIDNYMNNRTEDSFWGLLNSYRFTFNGAAPRGAPSRTDGIPFLTHYGRISYEWLVNGEGATGEPESLAYVQSQEGEVVPQTQRNPLGYQGIPNSKWGDGTILGPESPDYVFKHRLKKANHVLSRVYEDDDDAQYGIEVNRDLQWDDDGRPGVGSPPLGRRFDKKNYYCNDEPGMMLIMPNIADIKEVRSQRNRPYRLRKEHRLKRNDHSSAFCNIKDLFDYSYNHAYPTRTNLTSLKFYTDGTGWDLVNYNIIPETVVDLNKGSMFYADGKISLSDIALFFKTSIKSLLLSPLSREQVLDLGNNNFLDPYDYFDYEEFFRNDKNYEIFVDILRGKGLDKDDEYIISPIDFSVEDSVIKQEFSALEGTLSTVRAPLSSERVAELVENLHTVVQSAVYHLGMQLSYKTTSEIGATKYKTKLASIISLMAVARVLSHLGEYNYTARQKLIVLSLVSSVDTFFSYFSYSKNSVDNIRRAGERPSRDWAIACLHFMFMHLARIAPWPWAEDHAALWRDPDLESRAVYSPGLRRQNEVVFGAPWCAYWKYVFNKVEYSNPRGAGLKNDRYYYYPYGTDQDEHLITATNWQRTGPFNDDFDGNQRRAATERQIIQYLASVEYSEAREEWYDTIIGRYGEQKIIDVANVFRYQHIKFSQQHEHDDLEALVPGTYGSLTRAVYPDNNALILQVLREYIIDSDLYRGAGQDNTKIDITGISEDVSNRYNSTNFYESAYEKYIDRGELNQNIDAEAAEVSRYLTTGNSSSISRVVNIADAEDKNYLALLNGHIEGFISSLDMNLFYNLLFAPLNNKNYNLISRGFEEVSRNIDYFDFGKPDNSSVINQSRLSIDNGRYSQNIQTRLDLAQANQQIESIYMEYFQKNSPFIARYFEEKYNLDEGVMAEISQSTTALDLYKKIVKLSIYGSPSTHGQLTETTLTAEDSNLQRGIRGVEALNRRYSTAFVSYSGITEGILNASALSEAFIDGVLVKELIKSSEVKQVCRLVANVMEGTWDCSAENATRMKNRNVLMSLKDDRNKLVTRDYKTIQNISEEYRSFYMVNNKTGNNTFSVPMARSEVVWSSRNSGWVECFRLPEFLQRYREHRPYMVNELIKQENTKKVFNYALPVKRYQAVSTLFSVDALASYNTMPSVMRTPKATLSGIMGIASMNTRQRNRLFEDVSQSELFKTMLDDANTNPNGFSCFTNPFDGEFFDQFWQMFKELVAMFPSILFRGIADTIDPAYKEMKRHWQSCDIKQLNHQGLTGRKSTTNQSHKDMIAGLYKSPGNEDLPGLYAPIFPAAVVDFASSMGTIISSGFTDGYTELGRTLAKTTGYAYKGPISLVDGVFSFNIPCADIGPDDDWGDKSFNTGRYGHPYSPLTFLALITKQLPGDLRTRQQTGACGDIIIPRFPTPDQICVEEYPPPFGTFSDSED